jgi:hypothetical protein
MLDVESRIERREPVRYETGVDSRVRHRENLAEIESTPRLKEVLQERRKPRGEFIAAIRRKAHRSETIGVVLASQLAWVSVPDPEERAYLLRRKKRIEGLTAAEEGELAALHARLDKPDEARLEQLRQQEKEEDRRFRSLLARFDRIIRRLSKKANG